MVYVNGKHGRPGPGPPGRRRRLSSSAPAPTSSGGTDSERGRLRERSASGSRLGRRCRRGTDPTAGESPETPVVKDRYDWEAFKREYYYDDAGDPPEGGDGVRPFDAEAYLGFDPEGIESVLAGAVGAAEELAEIEERRTVYVDPELDEDAFFSTDEGHTTLVNRYDLEKTVPMDKKRHFVEVERYWVDKPYAFVVIFHSVRENEKKYYVVGPYLTEIESDLVEYFSGKLRTSRRTALTGRGEGDEPRHPAGDRRFVASESKTRP